MMREHEIWVSEHEKEILAIISDFVKEKLR